MRKSRRKVKKKNKAKEEKRPECILSMSRFPEFDVPFPVMPSFLSDHPISYALLL